MANDSGSYQPDNRTGTGFTNLQRIFQANQGNNLNETVGQGIQNVANSAQNQLQQGQNTFQQQANQGNLNSDANQQYREQALANPAAFANQQDINKFAQFRGGQYGGPQDIANIGQIQSKLGEAQQLGQATGSETGRMGLLQRFVGGRNYTQGQQQLDNSLLSQPGKNFGGIRQQTSQLARQGQQAEGAAQNVANQYGQQSKQFGQDTVNQLNTTTQNQTNTLDTRAQQLQAQQQQQEQQLGQGQISAALAQSLGLDPNQVLYNVNVADYIQNPADINRNTVASAQDRASLGALAKLSGTNLSAIDPNAAVYDPNNPFSINKDAMNAGIQAQQDYFNRVGNSGLTSNYINDVNRTYGTGQLSTSNGKVNYNLESLAGALGQGLNPNSTYQDLNNILGRYNLGAATGGNTVYNWSNNGQSGSTGLGKDVSLAQAAAGGGQQGTQTSNAALFNQVLDLLGRNRKLQVLPDNSSGGDENNT